MSNNIISGFSVEKAQDFIENHSSPFVKLLYLRDIKEIPITDSEFLKQQELVLSTPEIQELFSKQLSSGGWLHPNEESAFNPMCRSTPWILIYLGYLGINGSVIPQISKAVDYIFEHLYDSDQGLFVVTGRKFTGFDPCFNAMLMRTLLRMGFQGKKIVKEACMNHLAAIHNKEGYCKHKKGGYRCAWALTKDLTMLNEFPSDWRKNQYAETVKIIQDYLLSHNLAEGKFPRVETSFIDAPRYWIVFGYFRSYQSDIFEAAEALVSSGINNHPELERTLNVVGSSCIDGITWKNQYLQAKWPLKLETKKKSPFLTLRGLKIVKALS
jgi:hypothetical protein